MKKTLLFGLIFLFSAQALSMNVGDKFDTTNKKAVISNLDNGSIYSIGNQKYALISKGGDVSSIFNLKNTDNCNQLFEEVKKSELFKDIIKINDKQFKVKNKENDLNYIYYCSNGVFVEIRMK